MLLLYLIYLLLHIKVNLAVGIVLLIKMHVRIFAIIVLAAVENSDKRALSVYKRILCSK